MWQWQSVAPGGVARAFRADPAAWAAVQERCRSSAIKPAKAGRVVVGSPYFDDPPRRGQAAEQVLVQTLVAEPAVEALDEPVLLRLARRDVVPSDATFLLPT